MQSDRYTCEICEGTFIKGWSDAEAVAEADAAGLLDEDGDNAVVCDDCYREFLAWLGQVE